MSATLVIAVLGVLAAGVAVGAAAAVQRANVDASSGPAAPSSGPSSPKGFVPGERALKSDAAERVTRAGAPGRRERGGREERLRSRVALRGASRPQLLQAGRRHFADVFSDPLFDGRHPDPGKTVIGYRGDTGALVKDAEGRKLLLKSTLPLRARAANDELAPVDLSLRESTETFTTANSNADVQIFKDPARGISFLKEGFSVSDATAAGSAQADGVQTDGRVFFDDAAGSGSDVSFVVVPKPTGVEVGWLLATADAPETYTLKLDLPEGARVRRPQTDDPIPGDPPRIFHIVDRDGTSLAYITPPMTIDSDGVQVESSMRVVGRDRLVIDVKHHGKDLRFPLFVDPELMSHSGDYVSDWHGWGTYQTPTTPTRVATDFNHNYYGWALNHNDYYPNGAYMSMPTHTFFDMGTGRGFEYRAFPGTYVAHATFGNMGHAAIWPTGTYNAWYQGILNPARNAWQHVWSGHHSAFGITHDFGGGSGEQNYAHLGITATAPNYYQYLWSGTNRAWLTLDYANVYIVDPHPPQITSPRPADQNWSNAPYRIQTVTGSDHGTGLVSFRLTGPGTDKTAYSVVAGPCYATGDFNQHSCPTGYPITKDITYAPTEGSHTYTLTATDAAGNTSTPHTWTDKIDRQSPTVALSGALAAINGGELVPGSTYPLNISATDAGTGVASIKILFDGDEEDMVTQTCGTSGGCPMSHTYNLETNGLSPGRHTVTVQVTDVFGHPPTEKEVTFTAPGTPPSDEDPNVADETTDSPATPIPMTPTGAATTSAYTTETWLPGDTNTIAGVNVVTSTTTDTTALTGTVVSPANNNDPIQSATVTLTYTPCTGCASTSVVTSTDSAGAYAFATMPATSYTLVIALTGYGLYTSNHNVLASNESYYKQAELTTSAQTIDESDTVDRDNRVAYARAATGGSDKYPSVARVPPHVRVAKVSLNRDCSAAGDPNNAPVEKYPWQFYIQSVLIEEVRVLGYNERSFKAFASMVQNFAWYHANQPGNYDVDASTGDQCFRPHKSISKTWHRWLHESTFQNRVVLSNGKLEETLYASGRPSRPCQDEATDDQGRPLFTPGQGRASQYILKSQGEGDCAGDFSTWPRIVEYWDRGEVRSASPPRPPTVSHGTIPGSKVGVVLNFKSGTERGQAWYYSIQRKTGTGEDTQWRQIRRLSFIKRDGRVPTSITYETNNAYEYRVRAFSPVGSSRYVEFNNKFVIQPG